MHVMLSQQDKGPQFLSDTWRLSLGSTRLIPFIRSHESVSVLILLNPINNTVDRYYR